MQRHWTRGGVGHSVGIMTAHAYLDRFTVIGRCLVAEGWASDLDLRIRYDGADLPFTMVRVERPELVPVFGPDAASWGFSLCAALPVGHVDRTRFVVRFNDEIEIDDPATRFTAFDDRRFVAMTDAFRARVADRPGPLIEIGSRARSGATYRDWFPATIDYCGVDVTAGPNVDIVGDAHDLSRLTDRRFDYAFSIAVFEHLLMPWKIAVELARILNPGGEALIITHNAWPLHEEPWDFWRYSREAWSALFNAQTGFEIVAAEYQYPTAIVPDYIATPDMEVMSRGRAYLSSGCVVRRIREPQADWTVDPARIYDMAYAHGANAAGA